MMVFSTFNIALTVFLFGGIFLSLCSSATSGEIYYVSSNPTSECSFLNVSHCKTLNEYAMTLDSWVDDGKKSVIMTFLPGVHDLAVNFSIDSKFNVTLFGQSSNVNQARINLLHGTITVHNLTECNMYRLSINGFSNYTISLKNVTDVKINDVVITSSALLIQCLDCNTVTITNFYCVGSPLVISWPVYDLYTTTKAYRTVVIRDTVLHLSSTGNGLSCCNVRSMVVENTSISSRPSDSPSKPPESSLITFCYYAPWGLDDLEVCDLLTTNIDLLRIYNSTFKRTSGTGMCLDVPLNGIVTIINSTIIDHMNGGAMFTYKDNGIDVTLVNTTMSNNSLQGPSMASALSVYTVGNSHSKNIPKLRIDNTHFVGNKHLIGRLTSTISITSYLQAQVHNCNFTDNYGSAITAYTTNVDDILLIFSGSILFRNNTSHRGGALHLFQSRIVLDEGVQIVFIDNFAEDVGGAMYVHSTQWLSSYYDFEGRDNEDCFYALMVCHGLNDHYLISFEHNSAKNGGEHVFGAPMRSSCDACPFSNSINKFMTFEVQHLVFTFSNPSVLSFSPISSHPSRICICNDTFEHYTPHNFCTYTSQIFLSRSVHPGEEFHLEAVLVGVEFGTGTGSVYAQFLSHGSSVLYPPHQYSQRVDDFKKCTRLSYTVYSSSSEEVLVLTSTDETVLKYGDQKGIEDNCNSYHRDSLMEIVPPSLLTTLVYINLTLLLCPLGFHLTGSPPGCDCVPALVTNNIFCNFTHGIGFIYRNGTVWINQFNEDSVVLQKRCPFDYCLPYWIGVDLRNPDTQCAMNHAGTLCGGCNKGFSLALGTNACFSCMENKNLGLIIFFILAGLLLVVSIKVLNITVSQGTINGLVFYTNIVWAYQSVLFPSVSKDGWFSVMKTFIAWLNLDFGIQTCFFEGLTGYAKTWLQFVFPLYIWGIAGAMVISAHYSKKVTKVFGNNCVQVLATLFLLSYAKLFRTIITIMTPAVLRIYPYNSIEQKDISIVWAFDGNLSYGGYPHAFLLVVALLILICLWLPYMVILLFFRLLMKGSTHMCLKWINRIVPLIEPYFGPLKMTHYFWVGLLLLVRGVLLIILTLTYTTTPSASLLSLALTLALLFAFLACNGRVYQNKFLTLLECSFMLNLQVLAISVLFIDLEFSDFSKEIVVSLSITVAFAQFLGIICYHLYQLINANHCWYQLRRHQTENEAVHNYQLVKDESVNDLVKRDLIGLQYLEDYAENAEKY